METKKSEKHDRSTGNRETNKSGNQNNMPDQKRGKQDRPTGSH